MKLAELLPALHEGKAIHRTHWTNKTLRIKLVGQGRPWGTKACWVHGLRKLTPELNPAEILIRDSNKNDWELF